MGLQQSGSWTSAAEAPETTPQVVLLLRLDEDLLPERRERYFDASFSELEDIEHGDRGGHEAGNRAEGAPLHPAELHRLPYYLRKPPARNTRRINSSNAT